jgi:hypothetical protein
MLIGAAHIHFIEGERGPQEATLAFEDAMRYLGAHGIEKVVATFHLRHPSDLRLATPASLINLIEEYDGPLSIDLMPEVNLVFHSDNVVLTEKVSHDIAFWKDLDIEHDRLTRLVKGWIVSAHFTAKLGWSKMSDEQSAPEQTYEVMAPMYRTVMQQEWSGWIGHPFQYCVGDHLEEAMYDLLRTAIQTGHLIEVPIKPVRQKRQLTIREVRESIPQYCPNIIAQFAQYSEQTNVPLVAISIDAHHLSDLEFGLDNSNRVAEWMIQEGVSPAQIWGWKA